ncbi:MAG: response regulator transcription factor [Selenomonadaceae bacterium]|nr:response regulator transcription factor [Selenomonadaceae bacterium]
MKTSKESEITLLTCELMRIFFEKNDLFSFALRFADDVVYASAGHCPPVHGKDEVVRAFKTALPVPCAVESETCEEKILDEKYVMAFYQGELLIDKLRKRVKANIVYRKAEDGSWNIVSLAFAVPSLKLNSNIFPIERKMLRSDKQKEREEMLIDFLLEGLSNKEIARRFSLAEITIKKALSKIYQRYEVKNRVELVKKIS